MQLYEKYVISVHEEVKSVIRHYPFKNIEEISLLLEAEGFPFEEYGLGTLESVLQEIPEVAYIVSTGVSIIILFILIYFFVSTGRGQILHPPRRSGGVTIRRRGGDGDRGRWRGAVVDRGRGK